MSFTELQWQNLALDLLLFLATELIVQRLYSDYRHRYRVLLLVQLILIIIFCAVVLAFHHLPLLLILFIPLIAIRLVKAIVRNQVSVHEGMAYSKQLKHVHQKKSNRTSVGQFWSVPPNTDLIRRPVSKASPYGAHSGSTPVTSNKDSPYSITSSKTPTPTSTQNQITSRHYHSLPHSVMWPHSKRSIAQQSPLHSSQHYQSTVQKYYSSTPPTSTYVQQTVPFTKFPFSTSPTAIAASGIQSYVPPPSIGTSSSWISTRSQSSPPGIRNTGNICFLVSVIHCLAGIEGFVSLLSKFPTPRDESDINLISSLQAVIQQCQNWSLSSIRPNNLLLALSSQAPHLVTRNQSQQDAGEFLLWLLDNLHEIFKKTSSINKAEGDNQSKISQLKTERDNIKSITMRSDEINTYRNEVIRLSAVDYSILEQENMSSIYKLCCGQLFEARECQQCRKVSTNIEYYTILTLPVPQTSNGDIKLQLCFELFGQIERLSHTHNMFRCSCTIDDSPVLTSGNRIACLSYLPSHLIIQLSRFSYDYLHKQALKNQTQIEFPVSALDLSSFTLQSKLEMSPDACQTPTYDLCGFCVHTGARSTNYGHYIAYSKVKDGSWYRFDDDYVSLVTDIDKEIKRPFVSQNTYLIFYKAKETE